MKGADKNVANGRNLAVNLRDLGAEIRIRRALTSNLGRSLERLSESLEKIVLVAAAQGKLRAIFEEDRILATKEWL